MQDRTIQMIELALWGDATVAEAERKAILRFCRTPVPPASVPNLVTRQPERWISPTEASELLSVSLRTVQRWIESGCLPSSKINGCRRIPASALAALPSAAVGDPIPFRKPTDPAGLEQSNAMEA